MVHIAMIYGYDIYRYGLSSYGLWSYGLESYDTVERFPSGDNDEYFSLKWTGHVSEASVSTCI